MSLNHELVFLIIKTLTNTFAIFSIKLKKISNFIIIY